MVLIKMCNHFKGTGLHNHTNCKAASSENPAKYFTLLFTCQMLIARNIYCIQVGRNHSKYHIVILEDIFTIQCFEVYFG